jgi:hypothetical protein
MPSETRPAVEHPAALAADHITRSTRDPRETADRFARWLAQILPSGSNPAITEVVNPESTGMASETLLISTCWTDGDRLLSESNDPAMLGQCSQVMTWVRGSG